MQTKLRESAGFGGENGLMPTRFEATLSATQLVDPRGDSHRNRFLGRGDLLPVLKMRTRRRSWFFLT
jgi:hypothetical protein